MMAHTRFAARAMFTPFLLVATAASPALLRAQCTPQWVAGSFGAGVDGAVADLAALPNGDLVVAGDFSLAGGAPANRIARWDGTAWWPLGIGMDSVVNSLLVLPNGDLVAGGRFTTAGGVPAAGIARWDGVAWSPVGSGLAGPYANVAALALLPNGDLVAGGGFTSAGGAPASNIARWDGTNWSPLGLGTDVPVQALTTMANGDLIAGGSFHHAGGGIADCIARWDGVSWSPLGGGLGSGSGQSVYDLMNLPNGDLVAAGRFFQAAGSLAIGVAQWNGTTWSAISSVYGYAPMVTSILALPDGDWIAAGNFSHVNLQAAASIARNNGSNWSGFGTGVPIGLSPPVNALLRLPNGDVVIGGQFTTVNGSPSPFLARLATNCPASAVDAGPGCASSGGANTLTAATLPWTGGSFLAQASGLPTFALVAVDVGLTSLAPTALNSLPLPNAQPGCFLHLFPDLLFATVTTTGSAQWGFTIPDQPVFAGVELFLQMLLLEIDAQVNVLATTSTNALRLTVGTF